MISKQMEERKGIENEVSINLPKVTLEADLSVPASARGIVIFAHGSGSSRHSPRNRYVAEVLRSDRIATLLLDLLTAEEESIDQRTSQLRFNIPLLAKRLVGTTGWTMRHPHLRALQVGYFGASTGAAAALRAAAQLSEPIAAIVSRGGRPDLAAEFLHAVTAPTLLIVGEKDEVVIQLNQDALAELRCAEKKLTIVPGASHLFEEPGTLEEVARVASQWFTSHFARPDDVRARPTTSAG